MSFCARGSQFCVSCSGVAGVAGWRGLEVQGDGQAPAGGVAHVGAPVVGMDDGTDNSQAKSRSAQVAGAGGINTVEAFKDLFPVLVCYSWAVVSELDADVVGLGGVGPNAISTGLPAGV